MVTCLYSVIMAEWGFFNDCILSFVIEHSEIFTNVKRSTKVCGLSLIRLNQEVCAQALSAFVGFFFYLPPLSTCSSTSAYCSATTGGSDIAATLYPKLQPVVVAFLTPDLIRYRAAHWIRTHVVHRQAATARISLAMNVDACGHPCCLCGAFAT